MTENAIRSSSSVQIENRTGATCGIATGSSFQAWLKASDIMTENIATVSPACTVVSAAKIMWRNNISCLIVSDNAGLSGIVTETDMLKRTIAGGNDFLTMKVDQIMSSPVRSVDCDLSVIETSEIMEAENIRRLVVLDEGLSVGIITQTDMVRALAFYTQSKEVSQIMTHDVAIVASSSTVKEAADLMASQDISCLVVMDKNTLAGIFTERDLTKRVIAAKLNPDKTRLQKVMSSPVVTVAANYSVLSAQKLMEKAGIRRLVVTQYENLLDGYETLLGMITQTDILESLRATLQEEEEDYFGHLVESDQCIYAVNLDLNTTHISPSLAQLLDVTDSDELLDKPFLPERFWQNPRQRNRLLARMRRAILCVEELTLRTAKGKRLSVMLFSTPTRSLRGEICGCHGILCDVTATRDSIAVERNQ
ncbi:MAG: CBS domain-containing protein [Planctomycetota bacterium]|jgi:CBS domain-containing protein